MASFTMRKDDLRTCPYNPAHQVKAGRLHTHILKCSKQYTNLDIVICPFNAEHRVSREEFMDHIVHGCENKTTSERFLLRDTSATVVESAPTSSSLSVQYQDGGDQGVAEEEWDLNDNGGKKPFVLGMPVEHKATNCPPRFRTTNHMTPLEKRTYYKELHRLAGGGFDSTASSVVDEFEFRPISAQISNNNNNNNDFGHIETATTIVGAPNQDMRPASAASSSSFLSSSSNMAAAVFSNENNNGVLRDFNAQNKANNASVFNAGDSKSLCGSSTAGRLPRPPKSLPMFLKLPIQTVAALGEQGRPTIPKMLGIGRACMPPRRQIE